MAALLPPAPVFSVLYPGASPRGAFATICTMSSVFSNAAHATSGMELVGMSDALQILCAKAGSTEFVPIGKLSVANRPGGGTREDMEYLLRLLDRSLVCDMFTIGGNYAGVLLLELRRWSVRGGKRRCFSAIIGTETDTDMHVYVFATVQPA